MKRILLALTLATTTFAVESKPASQADLYFSPNGGCTEAIVRELTAARKTVFVQAYSFTSAPIAGALIEAHKRGVHVEVILDKSQRTERHSASDALSQAGIATLIDDGHASAHNKIIVIDDAVVITGSFDFSKTSEEKNAENLLVLRDTELAARYISNFKVHLDHSKPYQPVRSMDQIPMPKRPGL